MSELPAQFLLARSPRSNSLLPPCTENSPGQSPSKLKNLTLTNSIISLANHPATPLLDLTHLTRTQHSTKLLTIAGSQDLDTSRATINRIKPDRDLNRRILINRALQPVRVASRGIQMDVVSAFFTSMQDLKDIKFAAAVIPERARAVLLRIRHWCGAWRIRAG